MFLAKNKDFVKRGTLEEMEKDFELVESLE
jgi:hypothetical protein